MSRAVYEDDVIKLLKQEENRMSRAVYEDDVIKLLNRGWKSGRYPLACDVRALPPAQPEQKWTPCSDPSDLPKDDRLWITREIYGARIVYDVVWDMTEWSDDVSGVVAYMPYWEPEPYAEGWKND